MIQAQGESGEVIDQYNDHVRMQNRVTVAVSESPQVVAKAFDDKQDELTAYLTDAALLNTQFDSEGIALYRTGDAFRVKVMACKQSRLALDDVHIGIIIKRNDGVQCFGVSTVLDGVSLSIPTDENTLGVVYEIPTLSLLSGQYSLEIWLIDNGNGGFVGHIIKENIYYFTPLIENQYVVYILILFTFVFFKKLTLMNSDSSYQVCAFINGVMSKTYPIASTYWVVKCQK